MLFEKGNDIESMRIPLEGTYTDERYDHAGLVLRIDLDENKKAIQSFLNE